MSATRQLAWAWARQHRGRAVLTAGAIALAVSLVVFTVSGYRAALDRTTAFAREIMGPYDLVVAPKFAIDPVIGASLETELRADPAVAQVDRVAVAWGDIEDVHDSTYYETWRTAFLGTQRTEPPVELASGSWLDQNSTALVGVVAGGLASRWKVGVGDELPTHVRGGSHTITVIGVTSEQLAHGETSGVWVTPATAQTLAGQMQPAARLFVSLHDRKQADHLRDTWHQRGAEADPPVVVRAQADIASDLGADSAIKRLPKMGGSAAAIAVLAAIFIVYATASAGADERARQLAMLRTIGATRGQVAALVLWETLALALIGAAAGCILGTLELLALGVAKPDLFPTPPLPGLVGIAAGIAAACGAAIAAGLAPALAATRCDPVTAMAAAHTAATGPKPGLWRWPVGLTLVIGAAMVVASKPGGSPAVAGAAAGIGLLALAIAALVLAAPVAALVHRLAGAALASWAQVPPDLLAQQAAARSGRSAGTVLTLAVCLGLSVTMNVWGRTMVIPFLPSPQLPDVAISILPAGLPPEAADEVAKAPGLIADRVLPLTVEQTLLGRSVLAKGGGARDGWVQIIGLQPQRSLSGDDPLMPAVYESGGASEAIALLAQPGTCLVPPSLLDQLGLKIGDELPIMALGNSQAEVGLVIGGTASIPGWHWVTKLSRMRTMGGKPLAPVIVSDTTAQQLGISSVRHWFADVGADYDRAALRAHLTTLGNAHAGEYSDAHFGPAFAKGVTVKAIATSDVRDRIQTQSDKVIWVLGAIPLAALIVAVLGVANAVAAGVRARSWELGVLRAIGLEAKHTQRLIVIEAGLLALAAAVLSIVLGILAAWTAIAVSVQAFNAGGTLPPLIIPWLDIVIATAITTAVTVAAAWIPARRVARHEVLGLLQAGRAAG